VVTPDVSLALMIDIPCDPSRSTGATIKWPELFVYSTVYPPDSRLTVLTDSPDPLIATGVDGTCTAVTDVVGAVTALVGAGADGPVRGIEHAVPRAQIATEAAAAASCLIRPVDMREC
jgi:hypothetical protein